MTRVPSACAEAVNGSGRAGMVPVSSWRQPRPSAQISMWVRVLSAAAAASGNFHVDLPVPAADGVERVVDDAQEDARRQVWAL